jgi:hypothetical protein
MEKSQEETRALTEAARLREVVEHLRHLAAATTAELEGGLHVTSATNEISRDESATSRGLTDSESG